MTIPKFPRQPTHRSSNDALRCIDDLKRLWSCEDWAWFDRVDGRPHNVNLFAVRNPHHTYQTTGRFNDFLGLAFYDEYGDPHVNMYSATTEPGRPLIVRPVNRQGAGAIARGQYRSAYKVGRFKKWMVLKQVLSILVMRDNNRNPIFDIHSVIKPGSGFFIHPRGARAEAINKKLVGGSSAGCLVTEEWNDWEDFWSIIELATNEWGDRFTLTMLDMTDLDERIWNWEGV